MRLKDELPDLDGATDWLNHRVSRGNLVGEKPVLVHFWSLSCEFCKEELPDLNRIRETFKDQLHVLAIHTPRLEKDLDMTPVKKAAENYQLTHPILIDNDNVISDAFNNQYLPAYYIFDSSGKLRHYQAGTGGIQLLTRRIEKIIKL